MTQPGAFAPRLTRPLCRPWPDRRPRPARRTPQTWPRTCRPICCATTALPTRVLARWNRIGCRSSYIPAAAMETAREDRRRPMVPGSSASPDSSPVLLIAVEVSPRAYRAWPLAWPSPSGPLGRQRSPGSTARRRRVPRSGMRSTVDAGGASPDNARRSGPVAVTLPDDRRTQRERVGLVVVLAGAAAGYGGDRTRPVTGVPCAAAAAP